MLDEVPMATEASNDNEKEAKRAKARLAKKLKDEGDAKTLSEFKVWVSRVKDMVRISQKSKPAEPAKPTAAEARRVALDRSVRSVQASRDTDLGKRMEIVDDHHVFVPITAVNKAALSEELYGISLHVQGYILAHARNGVANYRGDIRTPALQLTSEQRGQIIAMHNWVNTKLSPEMRRMANIVIDQTLQLGDKPPPTVSEVGAMITASEDARVRKGGVIGYYRAMFQTIRQLQQEWHITQALRKISCDKN